MEHKQHKSFRSFVKEKGYYIVLLLCAVAVGTSGYFLLTMDRTPEQGVNPSPSAPTTTQDSPSAPTAVRPTQEARDALATENTEPSKTTTPTTPRKLETGYPLEGEVVAAFAADHLAYNETTRDWRTHEGIDLGADMEQPVHAAAPGTVTTIYEDERLGMTVVLQHSGGYTTHYSNLSEDIPVRVGDTVALGDVVGTVGSTACTETATVSHLHFAVYQNNRPVDPADFFEQ